MNDLAFASRFINEKAYEVFDHLDISDATRADYRYRVATFLEFVSTNGLKRDTYLDFKRMLANRDDLAATTKNKYLIVGKIFLKELNRQGLMPVDITQNIRGFEQGKKHKKDGLSQEEVLRIRNWMLTTPEYDKKSHIRRKAIFSLLLLQGLRQIEISRLDIKDVDFSQNVIWVRGKGRHDKERVDLHPLAVGYLYDYFSMYNIPFIHANKALFFSISNSSQGHRITTRGLRTLVTDVFREIGIKKSVHGCRHYFTTQLIKSFKGDLLKVKRYTRHKSVEMLQVYFDDLEAKEDLPEFYKAFDEVFF